MTKTEKYLQNLTKDLETVCKAVLPRDTMVPRFSEHIFTTHDDLTQSAITAIMRDYLVLEHTVLNMDPIYAVKLAIIKSAFLSDWHTTSNQVYTDGSIAQLVGCVTVDEMLQVV